MSTLAKLSAAESAAPSPLEIFELRCWARARLYAESEFELHEAVDALQGYAEQSGLVDEIGQASIQEILAGEFGALA